MNTRPLKAVDQIRGEYMLSMAGVCAKCDLGKTTVQKLVRSGAFPQPETIAAQVVRWRGSDIDAWIVEVFTLSSARVALQRSGSPIHAERDCLEVGIGQQRG